MARPAPAIDYKTLQKSPAYGDSGGFWRRRRLNKLAIAVAIFVPIAVFATVLLLLSLRFHYRYPLYCGLAVAAVFAVVILQGYQAFRAYSAGVEPMWYLFLCVTSLVAYVAAAALGSFIYLHYLRYYYEITTLQIYESVDPATVGTTYMDAGVIAFTEDAVIDRSRAMAFRTDHNFCVAPVSISSRQLAVYDYWMVGVDCCSSASATTSEFGCRTRRLSMRTASGGTSTALSAVRMLDDSLRDNYRLAVLQAESNYGIHSEHPLFLTWVDSPFEELEDRRSAGVRWATWSVIGFVIFHLCVVAVSTFLYGKFALYPTTMYR